MVVCDFNQHPPIKDVIYVVEDTAALATNFDELLNNYLVKALEYFNGRPHTTVEKSWASIECSSTFSVVLFKSADWRPDRLAVRRGPFSSAKKVFTALERIAFIGGQGILTSSNRYHHPRKYPLTVPILSYKPQKLGHQENVFLLSYLGQSTVIDCQFGLRFE